MSSFGQGRALVIGIASYQTVRSLPDAVRNDANALREMLVSPRCGYLRERVTSLVDSQATRKAILDALDDLAREATDNDTVFVYFSGHGGRPQGSSDAYVIAHDTDSADLANTAISAALLTDKLAAIGARKLVVFLDCCYAAGTAALKQADAWEERFTPGLDVKALAPLIEEEGRVILSSSKATETSLVLEGDSNSLFTKYVLLGLGGEAAVGGVVAFGRLADYVATKVAAAAHGIGRTQTVIYDAKKATLIALAYAPPDPAPPAAKAMALPSPSKLRLRIVNGFLDFGELGLFVADLSDMINATGYTEAGRPWVLTMGTLGAAPGTGIETIAQNLVDRLKSRGLLEYLVLALDERRKP
jgi:Caspase domain